MNTQLKKFLLPLAAMALVSSACDPFPAKPGGDPAIVRVITYGGVNGDSNTVETVTGGNTVSTDFAQPDDLIRIQFNKPMDGSTIQKYPNYNADGTAFVPPGGADLCTPADGLNVSSLGAGTTVCYDPASATDGGQMVITPGAAMAYGITYTISGTVKDYQGKSLTISVTLTVDKRPLTYAVDGYTTLVEWYDSGTATSYEVLAAPDVSGAPGTYVSLAAGLLPVAPLCVAGDCKIYVIQNVPHTAYWYEVRETTGATTTTRPAVVGSVTTLGPLTPTLGVASTATPPPVILKGIIRVAWGSIRGANGYDVETSTDGSTWSLFYHYAASLPPNAARTVYAGSTELDPRTTPTVDGTLTSGSKHYFRVTPTYASGFAAEKGNAASKVAP